MRRVTRYREGRCWLCGQQGFEGVELLDSPYVLTITENLFDDFFNFVGVLRSTEITTEDPIEYVTATGYRFVVQLQRFEQNLGQLISVLNGLVPGGRRPFVDVTYVDGLTGTLFVTAPNSTRGIRLVRRSTVSPGFSALLTPFFIGGLENLSTVERRVGLELQLEINEVDGFGGGI